MKKLSLVVAVALGTLVACNLATAQEAKKDAAKKGMRGAPSAEQLKKDLDLKDDQVPKVKAVMEERQKKMQELRGETDQQVRREKMRTIMQESDKKMKEILTDEQYKKLQEMRPQRGAKKDGGGEKKKNKKKTE